MNENLRLHYTKKMVSVVLITNVGPYTFVNCDMTDIGDCDMKDSDTVNDLEPRK